MRAYACVGNPIEVLFKPGFDKYSIIDLCHPRAPDVTANQTPFFKRPVYEPRVAHEVHYQGPIHGRLQSSYEDVEFELDTLRKHDMHSSSMLMFVGGGGRSIHQSHQSHACTHPRRVPSQSPCHHPRAGRAPPWD
eukprot:2727131-Pleurochrysis_carterae.AAC.1